MKILTHMFVAVIVAVGMLYFVAKKTSKIFNDRTLTELANSSSIIEKEINDHSSYIKNQVSAFCTTICEDRDFVMKLIVEQDFSAPEIADIAVQFMKPMGFSLLEITDLHYKILSSGHFPASTGSIDSQKKTMLENEVIFLKDNIKGTEVVSFQVKIPFSCSGVTLYCIGGITVNSYFIGQIKPYDGIQVLFKQENTITGMDTIQTISDLENNTIIINDKTWLAHSLSLPWFGEEKSPELLILIEKPEKISLLDLF